MAEKFPRRVLTHCSEFKKFWKDKGPFRYALTSAEYPPVLLELEEWIFGNDIIGLLKALMQTGKKIAIVEAAFNPKKKDILRPDNMIPWKIKNFPEQWNAMECRAFVPEGYLTLAVKEQVQAMADDMDADLPEAEKIEKGFFSLLEKDLEKMGYVLLKPAGKSKYAVTRAYLKEWEEDEQEAGIF